MRSWPPTSLSSRPPYSLWVYTPSFMILFLSNHNICITLLCYLFLIFRFLFRGSLPHSWGISALPKPRPHPPPRDPPSTPPNSRRWRPLPECPSPAQAEVRIIVIRWYKRVKDALQNYDEFSLREYSEVYLCMTKVYGVFFSGAFCPGVMAGVGSVSGIEAVPVMGWLKPKRDNCDINDID